MELRKSLISVQRDKDGASRQERENEVAVNNVHHEVERKERCYFAFLHIYI